MAEGKTKRKTKIVGISECDCHTYPYLKLIGRLAMTKAVNSFNKYYKLFNKN
jgi:hypothetical protein